MTSLEVMVELATEQPPAPAAAPPSSPVAVLGEAARRVHGVGDVEDKLVWVAEQARRLTAAAVVAFVAMEGHQGVTVAAGARPAEVERFARPVLDRVLGRRRSRALRTEELADDGRFQALLRRLGMPPTAASLVVPVPATDGPPHGALVLCHPQPGQFGPVHETLVQSFAAHLGVALDNAEAMKRLDELQALQREMVHQLQEAVRPPVPSTEGVELGVHYVSADPSSPTGGDLYDWLVLPDGDLHVAVVDVMGKGVGATQEALAVVHALRLLALDGCEMSELVARAADLTTAQTPELVATVMVVRFRAGDGGVELAGGGHPPALLVGEGGGVELVAAPGVPIGFPGAGSEVVVKLNLGRKDTLVIYTDGLIEATKDILAGLDRLIATAADMAGYPAGHLARALVERSLAGAVRRDDSLALVLRRRTPPDADPPAAPLGSFEYRFSPTPATIPLARHLFGDWLENLAVDDDEAADLVLVASELCSNAVRHASGAPGAVALRAWCEADSVVVEVEDDGAGFELGGYYENEVPGADAERGRGLFVVEALADDLSVRRADGHTFVRAVRRAVLPAS